MSAVFPGGVVQLTPKMGGEPNKVYATEYNKLQDEIMAIETGLVTSKLATLTSAPAANKVLTTDGSGNPTWAAKAPDADKLDGNDSTFYMPVSYKDGWIPTTFTSKGTGQTIKVPSGAASIYSIGDKIKVTDDATTKYFSVVRVENTLLTIAGDENAQLDGDPTNCFYSHEASPVGFPKSFAWTPVITGLTITGSPTFSGQFSIQGGMYTISISFTPNDGTYASSGGGGVTCPVPFRTANNASGTLVSLLNTNVFGVCSLWGNNSIYIPQFAQTSTYLTLSISGLL